jgi:dienelactone hydrolase
MSAVRGSCDVPAVCRQTLTHPRFAKRALAIVVALCLGAPALADAYRTFLPEGAAPFPAVLFVSGCSGFAGVRGINHYEEKAEELRREGHLVVFVDYLARAGLKNCLNGMTHEEAADELLRAAAWARARTDVGRIAAVGWSYGGGAMIAALARPGLELSRVVLIYPDCRPARHVVAGVPTLVLLAGNDDVMPTSACRDLDGQVRTVTYHGVEHGFDVRGLPSRILYPVSAGTIAYDAEADRLAWTEIRAFLK